jgi:hypothetical protein
LTNHWPRRIDLGFHCSFAATGLCLSPPYTPPLQSEFDSTRISRAALAREENWKQAGASNAWCLGLISLSVCAYHRTLATLAYFLLSPIPWLGSPLLILCRSRFMTREFSSLLDKTSLITPSLDRVTPKKAFATEGEQLLMPHFRRECGAGSAKHRLGANCGIFRTWKNNGD